MAIFFNLKRRKALVEGHRVESVASGVLSRWRQSKAARGLIAAGGMAMLAMMTVLAASPRLAAAADVSYRVTATIGVGNGPDGVAVDPSTGKVYVANSSDNTVSVIDEATGTVIATIPVGIGPGAVGVDPRTQTVYVANGGDSTVSVIDEATKSVEATIGVSQSPTGVGVDPTTGEVYVTDMYGPNLFEGLIGNVSVINESSMMLTANIRVAETFDTGLSMGGVAVDPSGGKVFVAFSQPENLLNQQNSGFVFTIDPVTNTVTHVVSVGTNHEGPAGDEPLGVGVDASTGKVYVANYEFGYVGFGTVSVIGEASNTVTNGIGFASSNPAWVGVDPSRGKVFVTTPDSNSVRVIDEATDTLTGTIGVGSQPTGVGVDPSTGTVYVANTSSNNVSVITPVTDSDLAVAPPANITTDSTGSSGAAVTYSPPAVSDPDDATPSTAVCDHASGSTFPIGTTTVTCTASDSNDLNSPVLASFTVTVQDTDLALTGMPSDVTVNATGPNGAAVTYTGPTAIDEDSPVTASVSCDHASGSTFPIGTTTVTCTASDSNDLNSPVSATFTVTVQAAAAQLAALGQAVQGVGPGTGLADKVAAAQSYLASGDTADACAVLTAFIQQVQAQSGNQPGKSIPAGQAAQLIADAQRIQAVLAC